MMEKRNQALICQRKGDFAHAESLYRECLSDNPEQADILYALGEVCYQENKHNEAIRAITNAVRLTPNNPDYRFSLGTILQMTGCYAEAAEQLKAVISINPGYAAAHLGLGVNYFDRKRYNDAINCYTRAAELQPNDHMAWFNLALACICTGKSEIADQHLRRALVLNPGSSAIHSCLLVNLHYRDGLSNREIFDEHLSWAKVHATPESHYTTHGVHQSGQAHRVRIGYISPDFRRHSVAFFIAPVLAAHDHKRFEVVCYSDVEHPDEVSARIMGYADSWREVSALNDIELAEQIRADEIDILVDLAGHTARNRLTLFARRPAPVQVTYLGYPGTSGMTAMDVRLTDQWADPEGESEQWYTERLVRLPTGFLCYEPPDNTPDIATLPAELTGNITFGSFNNLAKITPRVIDVWSRILMGNADAKLIMKAKGLDDAAVVAGLEDQFLSQGVVAGRVEYIGHIPLLEQHFECYGKIDVALDTFPYNGTTTTCEALWMGVPVITLAGENHAGRVGTSLLSRLGMDEYIAHSTAAYVNLAVAQSGQMEKLASLRLNLRERMRGSSLIDAASFCTQLEDAYCSLLPFAADE